MLQIRFFFFNKICFLLYRFFCFFVFLFFIFLFFVFCFLFFGFCFFLTLEKMAKHELNMLNALSVLNEASSFILPLMALIDYRGFRLEALSFFPTSPESLVYGFVFFSFQSIFSLFFFLMTYEIVHVMVEKQLFV